MVVITKLDLKKAILKESKAIQDYKSGNEKAFNYIYGKVDNLPWEPPFTLPNGKPLTVGHKIDPTQIKKIILDVINDKT